MSFHGISYTFDINLSKWNSFKSQKQTEIWQAVVMEHWNTSVKIEIFEKPYSCGEYQPYHQDNKTKNIEYIFIDLPK